MDAPITESIKTKYGLYSPESFLQYRQKLINRIWRLIPLREEKCTTLDTNIGRLNRELQGLYEVLDDEVQPLLTVIHLLENAAHEEDFKAYRADVLRCCDIVAKIGGGDNV